MSVGDHPDRDLTKREGWRSSGSKTKNETSRCWEVYMDLGTNWANTLRLYRDMTRRPGAWEAPVVGTQLIKPRSSGFNQKAVFPQRASPTKKPFLPQKSAPSWQCWLPLPPGDFSQLERNTYSFPEFKLHCSWHAFWFFSFLVLLIFTGGLQKTVSFSLPYQE